MSTPIGQDFRGPDGRIGYLLRQANQAMRTAIDQEMRHIGITASQFSLLSVIRHEPGLSGAELAEDSMLTQQTTSEIVQILERQGLVERRDDPVDRRARRIYLTGAGKSMLTAADERVDRLEAQTVLALDGAERRQITEWLVGCATAFADRRPNGRRRTPRARP